MAYLYLDGYCFFPKWLFPFPSLLMRDIREGMAAGRQEFSVRDTCGFDKRIRNDFPYHHYGGAVFRYTPATCQTMEPHCDFDLTPRLFDAPDDTVPLTLLIALEDDIKIDLWPGSHTAIRKAKQKDMPAIEEFDARLYLYEGDAILMRGDFVHAGIRGNKQPQRVLMIYIDHPAFPRDRCSSYVLYREPAGTLRADMMHNRPLLRN